MNPWKGLSSYSETDLGIYQFVGRSKITTVLETLIENNLLTTIYGKTGCGKTSLLQAGVFPLLRAESYYPMLLRLSLCKGNEDYGNFIIKSIQEQCKEGNIIITPNKILESLNQIESKDESILLWKFFYGHDFKDKETNNVVFPVVVIDQFEETFEISSLKKTYKLLAQINQLINDNLRLPEEAYANFRIVISIREDYLYMLEDSIDYNGFSSLKQNRQRIVSLNKEEAMEVIELGKNIISSKNYNKIAEQIISLATNDASHISTNMLSLICSQLYIQSNGNITEESLNDFNNNPLEHFYLTSIKHVSSEARTYIESNLVTNDRRNLIRKDELKSHISEKEYETLSSGENKILQEISAGNTECVELIHDSLVRAISHIKKKEIEQQKRRKTERNKLIKYLFIFCLSLFVIFMYIMRAVTPSTPAPEEMILNINIKEDSTITDLDYWIADLTVYAKQTNGKDTVLLKTKIDKTNTDSLIAVKVLPEQTRKISYALHYDKQYNSIYKDIRSNYINIAYFQTDPIIKIYAEKKIGESHNVSGRIIMDCDGFKINSLGSLVVINDQTCRTDSGGRFNIRLYEKIDTGDPFILISQGYAYDLNLTSLTDGEYIITPKDSLSNFEEKCTFMDKTENWWQYKRPNNGIIFTDNNGNSDRMFLFLKYGDSVGNGRRKIYGYYYFQKEKDANPENNHYAYHIFTGTMDSQFHDTGIPNNRERQYELTSYDIAGNKQNIKGIAINQAKKWIFLKGNLDTRYGLSGTFDSSKQ